MSHGNNYVANSGPSAAVSGSECSLNLQLVWPGR